MPRIRVISRSEEEYRAARKGDLDVMQRNPDPLLHPMEKPKEYTRALNAVKLDRLFAKPFIQALGHHKDGVYCLRRHPSLVSCMLSGACDGEIIVWSLKNKEPRVRLEGAHRGFVRGLAVHSGGERFVSCGDDKVVKIWKTPADIRDEQHQTTPIATYLGEHAFSSVDHQRNSMLFATSGASVDVWDHNRAEPLHSYEWGIDTVTCLRYNPIDTHIIAGLSVDCSILLYDVRSNSPVRRLTLDMKSNAVAWNPMEAFNFTVANDDSNCYSFDMRKLSRAIGVHKDHTGSVLDIDYSPTGREFVTGGFDKTLRIFPFNGNTSREVYHTKRMQRIFSVQFSGDSNYVLSASEDTNIRLWKAQASKPVGVMHPRAKQKLEYKEKLKERYGKVPEIRRIAKYRHVPKAIKVAKEQRRIHEQSVKRKAANYRKHHVEGALPIVPERKKKLREEEE